MRKIKSILLILFLQFIVNVNHAQVTPVLNPDLILTNNKPLPKVLLIGSWHFNYPGLDAHKIEEKNKINIYSEKRQKELEELLNYIAKFKPTKIMVESGPNTGYLKYNYKQWKLGKEELYASERSQIGMRLVEKFNLDTIYGVDDWPLILELNDDSSITKITYLDSILNRHYFGGNDSIQQRYSLLYSQQEKFEVSHTLLESFKYLNSEKLLNRYFGAYIAGGQFASKGNEGPDALSMFWFNRNLRIFRNIQKIETKENERILVIYGAGHIAILRWLFECSPEYQLVDFNDLGNE
jgi:hypothetical protein